MDVDRPTPLVEIDGGGERHLPSMQWPILEKLALIGLVGGIFSCVLDVDAAAWQVVGATVLLVLANAGISAALERRGHEWSSIAVEFVVLAVVNTALLLTYAALVERQRSQPRPGDLLRPAADDDHRPVRPLPRRTHRRSWQRSVPRCDRLIRRETWVYGTSHSVALDLVVDHRGGGRPDGRTGRVRPRQPSVVDVPDVFQRAGREVTLPAALALTDQGTEERLSLGVIGASSDPLIVAGELRTAIRNGRAVERCEEIAGAGRRSRRSMRWRW